MAKISDFYDAMVTKLGTVFPTHSRIPTPEKIDENPETILRRGQAFFINSEVNTNRNISCKFSSEEEVIVVITRKVYATELDVVKIDDAKKLVLEDHYALRKAIETDRTLGLSDTIQDMNYVSHSGVQFVFLEKENYIKIEANYSVEILDDI